MIRFTQFLIEQNEAFPPLFHGTSSERLVKTGKFTDEPIYLATEEEDAVGYARGLHLGGAGGQVKYVLTISAEEGAVLDADEIIEQIIADQHEQFEDIDDLITHAKKQGYRYIYFMHPALGADDHSPNLISLHPNQDLHIVGVEQIQ